MDAFSRVHHGAARWPCRPNWCTSPPWPLRAARLKASNWRQWQNVSSKHGNCRVWRLYNIGDLFVSWPPSIYYAEVELRRLQWNLYHIYRETHGCTQVMWSQTPNTQPERAVERVVEHVGPLSTVGHQTLPLRVSLASADWVFSCRKGMDIVKIEKSSVLHIMDKIRILSSVQRPSSLKLTQRIHGKHFSCSEWQCTLAPWCSYARLR